MSKAVAKYFFVFLFAFVAGVVAGVVFGGRAAGFILPAVGFCAGLGEGIARGGTSAIPVFALIFAKNLSVAALCLWLARPTRGTVPAWVCLSNGFAIGVLGALLAAVDVPVWQYAALLAPHGVLELPALFLACTMGMVLEGSALSRLRKGFPLVAALLAASAAVEVWISPIVGKLLVP